MPVAALAGGVVSGIGSLFAGNSQANAAKQAQAIEQQNQAAAVQAQNQEWAQQQKTEQPYLNLGNQGANALSSFLQTPFQAPTLAQAEQNPGYQFALQQGTQALDQSAAATGNLYSGTQGKALQQYGQQLGEQNYQQVYNNAMQQYMNQYGILSNTANLGANVAGQLGQQGQAEASNLANVYVGGAQQQAQQINNAAAARASGYVGAANGFGQGLTNFSNYENDQNLLNNFNSSGYGLPGSLQESPAQLSPVVAGLAAPPSAPTLAGYGLQGYPTYQ